MHTGIRPIEKRTGTLAFMASAGARAYNGGLGAEPPVGSQWEIYVAHLIRKSLLRWSHVTAKKNCFQELFKAMKTVIISKFIWQRVPDCLVSVIKNARQP